MVLETFSQQPAERLFYDVDFTDFLGSRGDTISSHQVTADAGLVIDSSALVGNVIRFYASGGENRRNYKVTVSIVTAGGLRKEADVTINVREQ